MHTTPIYVREFLRLLNVMYDSDDDDVINKAYEDRDKLLEIASYADYEEAVEQYRKQSTNEVKDQLAICREAGTFVTNRLLAAAKTFSHN
jgi:hypothetical protein